MRRRHTLSYSISIVFIMLLCVDTLCAQNDSIAKINENVTIGAKNETTTVKLKYGLRLGIDTGKLIRTALDDNYKAMELVADYRITKKLYIAGEIGNEEKINTTDFLDVTTSGTYFKAGIDYNLYQNWLDMDNMVYFGSRVGISAFNHTINEYTIYSTNQYWQQRNVTQATEKTGLTAAWLELIIGIKAELFTNLYFGLNAQLKILVTETQPDNFQNIFIPGFNKTYDSTRIGVGYGYTISYRIPLYKKEKPVVPVK